MNLVQRSLLRLLVRSKINSATQLSTLRINSSQPLVFVLKTQSSSDLYALAQACRRLSLPSPYEPVLLPTGEKIARVVYLDKPLGVFQSRSEVAYHDQFTSLLHAHKQHDELDVQLIPVTLFWGRAPGYEGQQPWFSIFTATSPSWLKKAGTLLFRGRDNLIRFSAPISLQQMQQDYGHDNKLSIKLEKIARVHFSRQKLAATGPKLPNRQHMQQSLMQSTAVKQAIAKESQRSDESDEKVQAKAARYLDEIASNFSYPLIRIGDTVLNWIWTKIYQGIKVNHAETVRQLAQQGHEIVFMPCHRSHMDYLLLSSIIYQQGMTPPHIAAGVNLNFFPAGPIFRRGGAFFIRRTFKGNPLYSAIFKAYLAYLFEKGYSLEFFTEGGRSRTGRLLPPKTGMLAMTVEAMQASPQRPISLVPVCLGYDHVMEVSTYVKEMQGAEKQKESFWQVLSITKKLQNFGHGFVNFGQPITLNDYLDDALPQWRQTDAQTEQVEARNQVTAQLGNVVMTRINQAAAANALPMTALILLAAPERRLSQQACQQQLAFHLALLQQAPYSEYISLPSESPEQQLSSAIKMNKFSYHSQGATSELSLTNEQATLVSFYRNNVLHLLIIPAIVSRILLNQAQAKSAIIEQIETIYPLLQAELFLPWQPTAFTAYLEQVFAALLQQGKVVQQDGQFAIPSEQEASMNILANAANETLQRHFVLAHGFEQNPDIAMKTLAQQASRSLQQIGEQNNVFAPEYFDQKVLLVGAKSWQGLHRNNQVQAGVKLLTAWLAKHWLSTAEKVLSPPPQDEC